MHRLMRNHGLNVNALTLSYRFVWLAFQLELLLLSVSFFLFSNIAFTTERKISSNILKYFLHCIIENMSWYSDRATLSLKSKTCIGFKRKMKVVLVVTSGQNSCQQRRTQWKWLIAINYTGHYEQSGSNWTHWAAIETLDRPTYIMKRMFCL